MARIVPDEKRGSGDLPDVPHPRFEGGREGAPYDQGEHRFTFLITFIDPVEGGGLMEEAVS